MCIFFIFFSRRRPNELRPTAVDDGSHYKSDDGLNSAASTLASIVSRQAFDIPLKNDDDDDDDDRRSGDPGVSGGDGIGRTGGGDRRSLPDVAARDGGGGRRRRDSADSGGRRRRDSADSAGGELCRRDGLAATRVRDPFGSPVTPQPFGADFRRGGGNARLVEATAAAASG